MKWTVRKDSIQSPANNSWREANCRISEMELRLTHDADGWQSVEVEAEPLGYGTYSFEVESDTPFQSWDPRVVLGCFLYGGGGAEIDFEISGFSDPKRPRLSLGMFAEGSKDWDGMRVKLPWNLKRLAGSIDWMSNMTIIACNARAINVLDSTPNKGQTFRFNLWHQGTLPDDCTPVTVRVKMNFTPFVASEATTSGEIA